MSRMKLHVAIGTMAVAVASQRAPAIVVGTFDLARGGQASVSSGSLADEMRAAIAASFPGVTYAETSVLTDSFLANIDVLLITAAWDELSPTDPLSPSEQASLRSFVEAGGGALLGPEGFFPAESLSFVDPFGMQFAGLLIDLDVGPVTDPLAHPITNGPLGVVHDFTASFPGYFPDLGPYAVSLATLAYNGESSLAVIDPGAISGGSGPVVIMGDAGAFADSDASPYHHFSENEVLFLNAFTYVVPEPGTASIVGVGALALVWRRRR